MRWIALLFVAVTFAGCAGQVDPPEPIVETPVELDDAMALYAAGAESANMALLGTWEQSSEEADAWEDYIFLDAGSTIQILQNTDRAGLELVEVSSISGTGPKDVKVSDDGKYLFIGNDEQGSAYGTTATGRAGGFYVYNIEDKANPDQTHFLSVGPTRGPHMVFYIQQPDGTELVLGANGDISINEFDRDTGMLTERSRYAPDYLTDVNRSPDVIDAYYQVYAHDMFAMVDGDRTLMYVANWDAGLRIVDITDPSNPIELGAWNDYPSGHSGNLHTVATEWIGDKRITVGSVEVGFEVVGGVPYALDNEKSIVYVWDTTDPADIQLIGEWENPDGIVAGQSGLAAPLATGDEVMSTHNFQLEGGIIYLAHYGLGVFIIDIRTPELQAEPQIIGFSDPGNTWDVIIAGGAVLGTGGYGLTGYAFPLLPVGPDGLFSRA